MKTPHVLKVGEIVTAKVQIPGDSSWEYRTGYVVALDKTLENPDQSQGGMVGFILPRESRIRYDIDENLMWRPDISHNARPCVTPLTAKGLGMDLPNSSHDEEGPARLIEDLG